MHQAKQTVNVDAWKHGLHGGTSDRWSRFCGPRFEPSLRISCNYCGLLTFFFMKARQRSTQKLSTYALSILFFFRPGLNLFKDPQFQKVSSICVCVWCLTIKSSRHHQMKDGTKDISSNLPLRGFN